MVKWIFETEAQVMMVLKDENGGISSAEVCRRIKRSYQNVCLTINTLKKAGYINTLRERRENKITLTETGKALAQKISEVYELIPDPKNEEK